MFAIQGDLDSSSEILSQPQWFNFDVGIISMALHHVPRPVDMLSKLRNRLRTGGALIVIEWCYVESHTERDQTGDDLDPNGMIEVIGGQKIWDGFTVESLRHMLVEASFKDIDVELPDIVVKIPDQIGSAHAGKEKKLMFVKGIA